jgi:hypothetical protein
MYFSFKFCIPTGVYIAYVQIFFSEFFELKNTFFNTYIDFSPLLQGSISIRSKIRFIGTSVLKIPPL